MPAAWPDPAGIDRERKDSAGKRLPQRRKVERSQKTKANSFVAYQALTGDLLKRKFNYYFV
jgi:hypothetical protein